MPTDILKWTATAILIIGTGINSLGFYPLGPIVLDICGLFWLWVACIWREPSLIVTNTVMSLVGISGLLIQYLRA
jgi:hypothetical protein